MLSLYLLRYISNLKVYCNLRFCAILESNTGGFFLATLFCKDPVLTFMLLRFVLGLNVLNRYMLWSYILLLHGDMNIT